MNKIDVTPNTSGRGFHIEFLNGGVDVPDTTGGYCISCGCGAGKTTSIRRLIQLKANEGILYCVDTVKELEKMHQNILWDIHTGLIPGLKDEDVICLRGHRNEKDGADKDYNDQLKAYKSDPSRLCEKKIILITHCRFFSELVQYFLIYTTDPIVRASLCSVGSDFKTLMGMKDVRKYILFDETPNYFRPLAKIPKGLMQAMTMDKKDKEGHRKFYPDPLSQYDKLYLGTDWDLFKGSSPFSKQKKYTILSSLQNIWPEWETDDRKELAMHFYPHNLIQPGMQSHVLIFEGVADVLLNDSRAFQLIDVPHKYNAKVNCNTYKLDCRREDSFERDTIDKYAATIEGVLDGLLGMTLVVVWKGIKGLKDDKVDKSPFRDELMAKIKSDGYTNFDMTYYGASNCKSTNDFKDFRNIILVGDWCIDVKDLQATREAYSSGLTVDRWKFYYFIQTICRIGIRGHHGGEYDVFFSSDFEPGFVDVVREYLNNNVPYSKPRKKVDVFENALKKLPEKRHREYLRTLAEQYPELRDAIEKGKPYTLTIPFDILKKLCPNTAKTPKPSHYDKFFLSVLNATGSNLRTTSRKCGLREIK